MSGEERVGARKLTPSLFEGNFQVEVSSSFPEEPTPVHVTHGDTWRHGIWLQMEHLVPHHWKCFESPSLVKMQLDCVMGVDEIWMTSRKCQREHASLGMNLLFVCKAQSCDSPSMIHVIPPEAIFGTEKQVATYLPRAVSQPPSFPT